MNSKPLVVITGSDGLIGEAIIRKLHDKYELVGLDNDRTSRLDQYHDLIYCDLTDEESTQKAFAKLEQRHGTRIASFVHLAAYYDFSGQPSPFYDKLTIGGTRRILEHLRRFHTEQFIFASTLLVMHPARDGVPIRESDEKRAEWAYPKSKLKAERLIAEERGDIPAVILRIGGVYDDYGHAVPLVQQARRIYERELESYVFPGNPSRGQAMVHLDDVVAVIDQAIEKRGELPGCEAFLIGEPEVMSYEMLQERLGELIHNEAWPTIRVPKVLAKAGARLKGQFFEEEGDFIQPWMIDLADHDYRVSIEKARRLLDWEPAHHLRDSLPAMVGHLLEDPAEWYRVNGIQPPDDVKRQP
jgi:nucleoside-diphosphate-sugar epimerase